jgi:hypothetical protein
MRQFDQLMADTARVLERTVELILIPRRGPDQRVHTKLIGKMTSSHDEIV